MISLGGLAIGYRQLRLTWQHRRQPEEQSLEHGSTTVSNTYGLPNMGSCILPAVKHSGDEARTGGLTGGSTIQTAVVGPEGR